MFGPQQCSEFEELSTGTAEEVLYWLCVLEVKAQVQSSAVILKERKASNNYAQAHPKKYCIEVKPQVRSSAVVSKER